VKGWRKTGRTRHKLPGTDITFVRMPRAIQRTVPDMMFVTFDHTQMLTIGAIGAGGFVARATICGNYPVSPYTAPSSGPTFIPWNTAVGVAAAGGFGATFNTNEGFTAATNPAYLAQFLGTSAIYENVLCYASDIDCEYCVETGTNSIEMCLVPSSNNAEATYNRPSESRFAKQRSVGYYAEGITKGANRLKHSMSTRRLYGLKQSNVELTSDVANSGSLGASQLNYRWNWILYVAPKNAVVQTTGDAIRIKMRFHCILFNPNPYIL